MYWVAQLAGEETSEDCDVREDLPPVGIATLGEIGTTTVRLAVGGRSGSRSSVRMYRFRQRRR